MESILVKFAEYPIVETDRLVLRPVTLDDAEAMFEYASDKENTRYTFPTNQGLTTEANRAVIELAFEKIGMNKLTALHDKDNPASGKVMEKSGMRFSHEESYASMDQHEKGRIVTRVHYVLTKEDYFANK